MLSSNLHVYPEAVRNLPIYRIDFNNTENVERCKQLSEYAGKMLNLQKDLGPATQNSNEWERLKSEIGKTDRKIDEEVYKLYGLTPEEIKVVEDNK